MQTKKTKKDNKENDNHSTYVSIIIKELHAKFAKGGVLYEPVPGGFIIELFGLRFSIKHNELVITNSSTYIRITGEKATDTFYFITKNRNKNISSFDKAAAKKEEEYQKMIRSLPEKQMTITNQPLIIRCNNIKCMKYHPTEDVAAILTVCTPDGNLFERFVLACFCKQCQEYIITEDSFNIVKKLGHILCKIIDERSEKSRKGILVNGSEFADESILHMMGYQVGKSSSLTVHQRHAILATAVDNHFMSRTGIINLLSSFIYLRQNKPMYFYAIEDWQSDIEFISTYELGSLRRIKF